MAISDTIKQIDMLVMELYACKRELKNHISETDKKVSDLYHQIENKNYDVVSGYKMLVKLQELLRIRRNYKGEFIKAQSATAHFSGVKGKIKRVKAKIKRVDRIAEQFPGNKLRLIK